MNPIANTRPDTPNWVQYGQQVCLPEYQCSSAMPQYYAPPQNYPAYATSPNSVYQNVPNQIPYTHTEGNQMAYPPTGYQTFQTEPQSKNKEITTDKKKSPTIPPWNYNLRKPLTTSKKAVDSNVKNSEVGHNPSPPRNPPKLIRRKFTPLRKPRRTNSLVIRAGVIQNERIGSKNNGLQNKSKECLGLKGLSGFGDMKNVDKNDHTSKYHPDFPCQYPYDSVPFNQGSTNYCEMSPNQYPGYPQQYSNMSQNYPHFYSPQ